MGGGASGRGGGNESDITNMVAWVVGVVAEEEVMNQI